jgi:hypothetical protein
MNTRAFRLLLIWNIVLTILLLIALAFAAVSAQAANDPPVKVYSASLEHNSGATGGGAANKTISSTTFTDILTVNVNFGTQTHNHQCVVIPSARVDNPAVNKTGLLYDFAVTYDSFPATSYNLSHMTLEFSDHASFDDVDTVPVTTNRVFTNIGNGMHTLRFQARKGAAANPTLTITNAYMSVICVKVLQPSTAAADGTDPVIDIAPLNAK